MPSHRRLALVYLLRLVEFEQPVVLGVQAHDILTLPQAQALQRLVHGLGDLQRQRESWMLLTLTPT
eukprot:scaffold212235_cov15-Tisochrysis_lutea.AAC.1